jgi:BirA family biotin operon repressor/biotin-[acetyl-CoA-carboxylase] ligase
MFDPPPADVVRALDEAAARLGGFCRLRYRAEVRSTNDLALSLALAGEPAGTIVLADGQHAGRGRRGHDWFSPPGAGLYLSVIVRPRGPAQGTALVTLAAGVAVADAVRAVSALPVELKWPNDLVVGRPWRKLGGVLCEAVGIGPRIDAVVVGIGLNLSPAVYPANVGSRATSIEVELGRPVDRAPVLVEILAGMRTMMEVLDAGDPERVCAELRRLGQPGLAGAPVQWREDGVPRRGRARGIDGDGALLVERGGQVERVMAGDVEWEMWGT